MRKSRAVAATLSAGALAFLLGPRVLLDDTWPAAPQIDDPVAYLQEQESSVADIRPGDEKGIVWADPVNRITTPLSIVYLHGFSADRHELEPLISMLGSSLNANIFFTRLNGHARTAAALGEARASDWLEDTVEALTIGLSIGDRVVLIGTSTGGTLAVWAATRPEVRSDIAAVVLLSPNLKFYDSRARVLRWPWGQQLTGLLVGSERCHSDAGREPSPAETRHWTVCFPSRVLVQVAALVRVVQVLDDGALTPPTLAFFSDIDMTIDGTASRRTLERLSASAVQVESVTTDPAGDGHVLAGDIMSPGSTQAVFDRVLLFLQPASMSLSGNPD
jgi:esterase/lipase